MKNDQTAKNKGGRVKSVQRKSEKPLTLAPVKFEDAVKAALETKPEKKKKRHPKK